MLPLNEVQTPEVVIPNTIEVVSPLEEVKTREVAMTKPSEVVLPSEKDIALEVAYASKEENAPKNYEISLSYLQNSKLLDRESTEVDDVYTYFVACDLF